MKANAALPCRGEAELGGICPELVLLTEVLQSPLEILKKPHEHDPVQLAAGIPALAEEFDYDQPHPHAPCIPSPRAGLILSVWVKPSLYQPFVCLCTHLFAAEACHHLHNYT